MSEQANVERIQDIYAAFGRGDVGHIVGQLSDDVRWVTHLEPEVPWSGDFSGKASVPRFFEAIFGSVDVLSFTPREFVAQGDTVVSLGEFGCRVRATGKQALTPWVFVWKLREGRIASYEQFHAPEISAAFR
jgi:ketosteroid isomerase-like protein